VSRHTPDLIEIDTARVRHFGDRAQSLLQSFSGGAALAAGDVVHAGADLQQHAHERNFVAHGLEVELFEHVAGLEPVAFGKVPERGREARIILERRRHFGSLQSALVVRALAILILLPLNLLFWGTPVMLGGIVKLLTFGGDNKRRLILGLTRLADGWVACNGRIFDTFLDTKWHVEGLDELRPDGHYLVVSNHVSWVDIFAVFRVFHRRAPFIRFFLKQALIWFPVAGQACAALGFPFMRRYTAEYLARHPEKRGRDLETTRIACRRYRKIPVTILNFAEGTRFDEEKREDQASPYRHLLRPRIGGIGFVIASMADVLDAMYDLTLVYPNRDVTMWQFISNRLPWVEVRARRIEIPAEFHGAAVTEPGPERERFKAWVEELWRQKDETIEKVLASYRGTKVP
jgi:1-acyl-sn-glycerol-3-phosphate acyltransferase